MNKNKAGNSERIELARRTIESIIADYCEDVNKEEGSILKGARFAENPNQAPQECANRIMEIIEGILE